MTLKILMNMMARNVDEVWAYHDTEFTNLASKMSDETARDIYGDRKVKKFNIFTDAYGIEILVVALTGEMDQ